MSSKLIDAWEEGWERCGESGMDAGNGVELGNGNGNVECRGAGTWTENGRMRKGGAWMSRE